MSQRITETAELRKLAVVTTQRALNFARREIRRQITSGLVNPEAIRGNKQQYGYPPTKIDAMMDRLVRQLIQAALPECIYLSEESQQTVYPDPGDIFAWCDPLDGTTNAFTIFSGYAVVLFFERWSGDRFDHLAGAIAAGDGTVVSWQMLRDGGDVYIDWPSDFDWPSQPQSDEVHRPAFREEAHQPSWQTLVNGQSSTHAYRGVPARIAAVAATPSRLRPVGEHYDLFSTERSRFERDRRWLSTIAGNPCIAPLLLGDLGAIIEPREVKMYDAIYLVPLVLAGGHVYSLATRKEIDPLDYFAIDDALDRTIDPFLAAVDPRAIDQLRPVDQSREQ